MILYTFRTNKNIDQFLSMAGLSLSNPVFVVDKPSEDIPKLLNLINNSKPDWVLGFASIKKGQSRWEEITINKFGAGRVSKKSAIGHEFKLGKPDFLGDLSDIKSGKGMSAGFCSQAAFRVAEFIKLNDLETESGFLHFRT